MQHNLTTIIPKYVSCILVLTALVLFSLSVVVEWNAHENAVFDIAWMQGEQMLVRVENCGN